MGGQRRRGPLSGQPTIIDTEEVVAVFGRRVSTILLEDVAAVPRWRRCSATIVDFTQPHPYLVREGSVPADKLAAELRRLDLGELMIGADVRHVLADPQPTPPLPHYPAATNQGWISLGIG